MRIESLGGGMEDGTWNKAYCFVFITCTMGSVGWFGQGHNSQGTLCPRDAPSKNFFPRVAKSKGKSITDFSLGG